jgi:hypothetical protein
MSIKLLIPLMFCMMLFSFASATTTLGTIKQSECIEIPQVCASCTYVNLSIQYPNKSIAVSNQPMVSQGAGLWTYNFCNTSQLGRYDVSGQGDLNGIDTGFSVLWFEVSPSGQGGNTNTIFFIFVILLIYGITFIGFFNKNAPITILGGMAMIFLGVYMVNHGIIVYQDTLTNYISYLTIGIGFILSFWALWEEYLSNF